MYEAQGNVAQLGAVATKQKQIVKVTCINGKLTEIKGHIAVANNALGQLTEAAALVARRSESDS